jgi:DNA-binding CsgD family transcriptional regulator
LVRVQYRPPRKPLLNTRAIADARQAADLIPSGRPFMVALDVEAAWLDLQSGDLDAAGDIIASIEDLPRFERGQRDRDNVREAWRAAVRQREGVTDLTAREREVLALLPTRLTLQEIADRLYVSNNTVKSHVKSIYVKLNVTNRDEATARAAELRLALPSPDS